MNRLQYRHAFAMRYFERTGNYLLGWLLSKPAADKARCRYHRHRTRPGIFDMPKPMFYHGCSPGVIHMRDPRIVNIEYAGI